MIVKCTLVVIIKRWILSMSYFLLKPYSHTIFLRTILQYCDKKIKDIFLSKYCNISKSSQLNRNKYFQFTQGKKYWIKNVFLLQYLFISILWAKILCVNKAQTFDNLKTFKALTFLINIDKRNLYNMTCDHIDTIILKLGLIFRTKR